MHSTRKVTDDLIYVGGSDRRLSRFENLFPIPKGEPVFDGIQVSIGYSSVQVPSTMNRPSDRLISRPTISPGVCRSVLRAAYRMSVLFLPCAFSVSFFVCFY